MDVSSRYFTLLRKPGVYWPVYLWRFLGAIRRVGKWSELISFAQWEVIHRLRLYQLGNRYLTFTNDPYLVLGSQCNLPDQQVVSGLVFQPVTVDWKYCIETPDGQLWGCCFSHPNALYHSDDQSQSAILRYEFQRPITRFSLAVKISSSFVPTGSFIGVMTGAGRFGLCYDYRRQSATFCSIMA